MESCGNILKSKNYSDNNPVVRENAECVKKLFHIIQSHLTGDWAQYSMHFFSNKEAYIKSYRWSSNFTIPVIKVLSVWICFWKWPCQSLRSGDAAHFNRCFLPWLDWNPVFLLLWPTAKLQLITTVLLWNQNPVPMLLFTCV